MPLPSRLRKPAALLAGAALVVLAAALAFRWWDRLVEDRLGRWAVAEVARRTGGAYHLKLGDISFLPLAGSIAFDSAIVTTDSLRNRHRAAPLPTLRSRAEECRVSGLNVPRLLLRRSFAASELGCRRVVAGIGLPVPDGGEPPTADSTDAATPGEELARPLDLRSFRIGKVSFPRLDFSLTRPGERWKSVQLQGARFEARSVEFDPAAEPEDRTLSAERALLTATGLVLRRDSLSEIAFAGLAADLIDSTLTLAAAKHEPAIPEGEWARRVRVRRDRIRFELDSLRARGVAYGAFVASGAVGIRALELRGPRLDVLTDRRIPKGLAGRPRRTPQQVAARTRSPLRVDTLLVSGGTITYRERKPGRSRPGRVSFDSVQATVHDLDLPAQGAPLRISARARLMNEGLLTVEATVPLDAPDFRYQLTGRLGGMRAAAFNQFLTVNEDWEFGEGTVDRIDFRQSARAGRVVTTLTPRYHDLSVSPTGDRGGLVGSVKRTVEKFLANAFVVEDRNPDEDGEHLRTARTVRRYDGRRTWIQFLWVSLRDGLMEGLKE